MDTKGNMSTELLVMIEMPAFQIATQFCFSVKPSKQNRIFDGIEDLVGAITSEFSEDLLNVDESATQRQLEMLRKKAIAEVDAWNQKLRTAEDWKWKAHRAGEQMNSMRDAYFKEISCLREQVFQKQKNEQNGVEFKPVDMRSFDPDEYTLVDPNAERQKSVDEIMDEHSKEMKLTEKKFNNKISHLQDQLKTTKMVLSRKEILMEQYLEKIKQRETHSEQVPFAHIAVQTSMEDFDAVRHEDASVHFWQTVCEKLGVPLAVACEKLVSLFSPNEVLSGACITRLINEIGLSHDPIEIVWSFMSSVDLPMHDLLRRVSQPKGAPLVDGFLCPVPKKCGNSDDFGSSAEMKSPSVSQQRRGSTGNIGVSPKKVPTKKRVDQGVATDILMDCGIQAAFTECSGVLRDTKEVGIETEPFEPFERRQVELVSRAVQSNVNRMILDQAEKYFDEVAESNWNDLASCSEDEDGFNELGFNKKPFRARYEGMFSSLCEGDDLANEEKEPCTRERAATLLDQITKSTNPVARVRTFDERLPVLAGFGGANPNNFGPESAQGMINRFSCGSESRTLVQDEVDVQDLQNIADKRIRPPQGPPRTAGSGRRVSIPKAGGPNQLKRESNAGTSRRPTISAWPSSGFSGNCSSASSGLSGNVSGVAPFGSSCVGSGNGNKNFLCLSIGGPPEDLVGPVHVEERTTFGKSAKDNERSTWPLNKLLERVSENNFQSPPPVPPKRGKVALALKPLNRGSGNTEFVVNHIKGLGNAGDMASPNERFSERGTFHESEFSITTRDQRNSGERNSDIALLKAE